MRQQVSLELPNDSEIVRPESIGDQTYRAVKKWLISGRIESGARVSERRLAEALGVSRTPLREVLLILERERLVERGPTGALRVTTLSRKDVEDIYACRMRLETLAVREAARNASEAQLDEMRREIQGAREAHLRGDVDGLIEHNGRFHDLVYESSGNDWLQMLAEPLRNQLFRARVDLTRHALRDRFDEEHNRIFEALVRRDFDAAEEMTALHIQSDLELHLSQFQDSDAESATRLRTAARH